MTALEPDLTSSPLASKFAANLSGNASTDPTLAGQPSAPLPTIAPVAPSTSPFDLSSYLSQQQTQPANTSVILPNLPSARAALARKYSSADTQTALSRLPEPVRNSLIAFDTQRVNKGQFPLSTADTAAVANAAITHHGTGSSHDSSILGRIENLPGSVIHDTTAVLKSLPRLLTPTPDNPIFQEVFHHLPHWGAEYAANIKAGMNPVAAFFNSPGIRFIPGSFILGNLAQGGTGLGNLLDHPVFTALDALPYAENIAGRTATATRVAEEGGTKNALRAVLTKTVDDEGNILPAKLGRATTYIAEQTGPGRLLSQAFGQDARDVSKNAYVSGAHFAEILNGNTKLTRGSDLLARADYQQFLRHQAGELGITPQRMAQLTPFIQDLREGRGVIDTLPEHERTFLHDYAANQDAYAKYLVDNQGFGYHNGELHPPETLTKISRRQEAVAKTRDKIATNILPRVDQMVQDIEARVDPATLTGNDLQAYERTVNLRDTLANALDPDHPATFKDAAAAVRNFGPGRTALGSPSLVGEKAGPLANIRLDTLMGDTGIKGSVRAALKANKNLAKLTESAVPARFIPLIQKVTDEQLEKQLIDGGVSETEAARVVAQHDYEAHPDLYSDKIRMDALDANRGLWQTFRDSGADPMFVHHAPAGIPSLLRSPRIDDYVRPITQAQSRELHSTAAYNHDLTVASAHQGAEIVANRIQTDFLNTIMKNHGVTEADAVKKFLPLAEAEYAANPALHGDPYSVAQRMALKTHVPYDPKAFNRFPLPTMAKADEQLWLPRPVADTLRRLHDTSPSALQTILGPPTAIFRGAVLPFSPRWLFNNVFGNTFFTAVEDPRAFAHIPNGFRLWKAMREGSDEVPLELRANMDIGHREWNDVVTDPRFKQGRRGLELLQKFQESRVGNAVSKVPKAAFAVNAFFDDIGKLANWDYARTKLANSGVTGAKADAAALDAAYRVSVHIADMTPLERQVLRQVFPFYSFTSKMMRNVLAYPARHPIRSAVLANMTHTMIHDHGDSDAGLTWLDSLGLGPLGKNGKQRQLYLKGINPFGDVADSFTVAGLLSGLNPVIETGLAQGGLSQDSQYASQHIDPETGRLVNDRPGLLTSAAYNLVPQTQFLARVLGADPDFQRVQRDNPDTAARMLMGGIGFPTPVRNVDVPRQTFTAELARRNDMKTALADALKSGDWTHAATYPELAPILAAVAQLRDNGQLDAYNPRGAQPSNLQTLAGLLPG